MISHSNQNKNVLLNLQPHQVRKLVGVIPGTIISCDKGMIWLTESDDRQDYALRPGHRVVIRQRGEVLIEALNESDLHISYPN
ncbi:MAG TPA: DUF2917 domain-containing protein [Anaerolineales bacterium]|nr:DUF2917 domain-containing protein [Anaerolineales bacterium]